MDRRIRRTRRSMRNAIIQLVLDMGYENITIQNITDTADISRATFYLHYNDKDALLQDALNQDFEEFIAKLETSLQGLTLQEVVPRVGDAFLGFIARHRALYYNLLINERGVPYAMYTHIKSVAQVIYMNCHPALKQAAHKNSASDEPLTPYLQKLDLTSHHIAGSLVAIIIWWLDHDLAVAQDTMLEFFTRVVLNGVSAMEDTLYKE